LIREYAKICDDIGNIKTLLTESGLEDRYLPQVVGWCVCSFEAHNAVFLWDQ
jgi:hypothetical protein